MAFYNHLWFWFMVIAIVLFVLAIVIYAIWRNNPTPPWFWFLLILALLFAVGAIIVYLGSAYGRKTKVAEVPTNPCKDPCAAQPLLAPAPPPCVQACPQMQPPCAAPQMYNAQQVMIPPYYQQYQPPPYPMMYPPNAPPTGNQLVPTNNQIIIEKVPSTPFTYMYGMPLADIA